MFGIIKNSPKEAILKPNIQHAGTKLIQKEHEWRCATISAEGATHRLYTGLVWKTVLQPFCAMTAVCIMRLPSSHSPIGIWDHAMRAALWEPQRGSIPVRQTKQVAACMAPGLGDVINISNVPDIPIRTWFILPAVNTRWAQKMNRSMWVQCLMCCHTLRFLLLTGRTVY